MGVSEVSEELVVALHEERKGKQYYKVTLLVNHHPSRESVLRFKDFENFHDSLPKNCVATPFPSKHIFFATKADLGKRSLELQHWLSDLLSSKKLELLNFLAEFQIASAETNNNNNNTNTTTTTTTSTPTGDADDLPYDKSKLGEKEKEKEKEKEIEIEEEPEVDPPHVLYCIPQNKQLRMYNEEKKNWPKIATTGMCTETMMAYYNKSIVNTSMFSTDLSLNYIPWGQRVTLVDTNEVFPKSTYAIHKICMVSDVVWIFRDGKFAGFNILTTKWIIPENIPNLNDAKNGVIVSVGTNVHIVSQFFHQVYNTISCNWSKLKPPAMKFLNNLGASVSAGNNYFFAFTNNTVSRYNVSTDTWNDPKVLFDEETLKALENAVRGVTCTYDPSTNMVHAWTETKAYSCAVEQDEWKENDDLFFEKVWMAFVTTEFSEPVEKQEAFEALLMNKYVLDGKKSAEEWQKLFKNDQISEELKEKAIFYESLPVSDRVQFFKQNTEACKDLFRQAASANYGHVFDLTFQLAREAPTLGPILEKMPEFSRYAKKGGAKHNYYLNVKSSNGYYGEPDVLAGVKRKPKKIQPATLNMGVFTKASLLPPLDQLKEQLHQQLKEKNVVVPDYLLCPITQTVFYEPVITKDGQTYEKSAILEWFSNGHKTSPLTNEVLSSTEVIPNLFARNMTQAFLADHNIKL